jgi:hypothetical protein
MVRDTGFEPPPASLREALRARCDPYSNQAESSNSADQIPVLRAFSLSLASDSDSHPSYHDFSRPSSKSPASMQHMEPEDLDIERISEDRRKAVEQSIQVISIEDLKSLGEELFPFLDHPWRQRFFEFIEGHASDTVYHGKSDDGFEVIYCPSTEKGMWFTRSRAMGPLQPRAIAAMKEIVGKR